MVSDLTPERIAELKRRAEAAWEAWADKQGDDIIDQPSNLAIRAFFAGYAAATADTEAQVRAMREAIQDHMNRPDYWDGLRKAMEER